MFGVFAGCCSVFVLASVRKLCGFACCDAVKVALGAFCGGVRIAFFKAFSSAVLDGGRCLCFVCSGNLRFRRPFFDIDMGDCLFESIGGGSKEKNDATVAASN